jgi:hypothetical protein
MRKCIGIEHHKGLQKVKVIENQRKGKIDDYSHLVHYSIEMGCTD